MNIKSHINQGKICKINPGNCQVIFGESEITCSFNSTAITKQGNYQELNTAAVGDNVLFENLTDNNGRIVKILPRKNSFSRLAVGTGSQYQPQLIGANLDLILPVFSVSSPTPKWGLLDRYLVSAEASGIDSVICISKVDLSEYSDDLEDYLSIYRRIGYPIVKISTKTGQGFSELIQIIGQKCGVLVGKSGVGKSSILNGFLPELALKTQEVSRIDKGRHTTTSSRLYRLDNGGLIADTPGIREFGLWDIYQDDLTWCFPEMRPYIGQCSFRDCTHNEEPGCAVRQAVMQGHVSPQRYRSMMQLAEELI